MTRCLSAVLALLLIQPPHRTSSIGVAPGVRLEVIDFGGMGPALVFLAGFGNSAHVYDGFAPQFTDRFHVIGITRRGFGASSHAESGFGTARLARDVVTVLDSLHLTRASFVGHSFAGSELNYIGAHFPTRVDRLIYLDASYDFPALYADDRWKHAFPIPRPAPPSDARSLERWLVDVIGPGISADEATVLQSPGAPGDALQAQSQHVDRRSIRAPVLAVWAMPATVRDQYPFWPALAAAEQSRLEKSFELQMEVRADQLRSFRAHVPQARVVEVAHGRHYVFLSHPREVAVAMRSFLER